MDAVMDLTARAVSLITLIEDVFLRNAVHCDWQDLKAKIADVFGEGFEDKFRGYWQEIEVKAAATPDDNATSEALSGFETKIYDLGWISSKRLDENDTEAKAATKKYLLKVCTKLAGWIMTNEGALVKRMGNQGTFSSPYSWRESIEQILYADGQMRISLAKAVEHIPIQVVLALGGAKYDAPQQRLLQWWPDEKTKEFVPLTAEDKKLLESFQQTAAEAVNREIAEGVSDNSEANTMERCYKNVETLLTSSCHLKKMLKAKNVPLSFEYILNDELAEIAAARKLRNKEVAEIEEKKDGNALLRATNDTKKEIVTCANSNDRDEGDPFLNAQEMGLVGLAFSGGGIRSATFNLGIVQSLAQQQGLLSRIDYLSTVSGGGYIGSWLTAWIKREGSITKVSDRLDPRQSPEPMAEEVRPIRWLRMFSNYLTPAKSIMSVDSWTVGMTWLRNTLLNQLVIFFMLSALLFGARFLFEVWLTPGVWTNLFGAREVYVLTCVLMVLLAAFITVSIQWFDKRQRKIYPLTGATNKTITNLIIVVVFIGAYIASASLNANKVPLSFWQTVTKFWIFGLVSFLLLTAVGGFGGYHKCIAAFPAKWKNQLLAKAWAIFYLTITSALAAFIGVLVLAAVWQLFTNLDKLPFQDYRLNLSFTKHQAFAFTIGTPVMLLILGVTVTARMAFLGKYFPDERREWWGRIGAAINRLGFLWLVVACATLFVRDLVNTLIDDWKAPATVGGWMALVYGTVKAASSSKTSGKEGAKGIQATLLSLLSMAGPYLFALGLLVFLPAILELVMNADLIPGDQNIPLWAKALGLALGCCIPGLFLSWRLGVNEFSMHHFSRNRLVRAYLGASRPKVEREKTANPFTGFDTTDDEKLANFTVDNYYYGPYPLINTALNASQVSDFSRQDRKAESFVFSPLYCGFDFSKVRSSVNSMNKSYDYGFRSTGEYAYPAGPAIGTAMAISGAAANPNQGYHSSAGTAFLLTVFNVQLGWWIGNPRKSLWQMSDPPLGLSYLFFNLVGQSSTRSEFVCLSDGGHFDNMGLYELVRRRCRLIILGDAEQDESFGCEGLANAIRRCRVDFGVEIDININDIKNRDGRFSKHHHAIGKIHYPKSTNGKPGILLYIKSSLSGNEPVDVTEYAVKNPDFPHQTTGDQFFDESQFESYRKLGMHIGAEAIEQALKDPEVRQVLRLFKPTPATEEKKDQKVEAQMKELFAKVGEFFKNNGDNP